MTKNYSALFHRRRPIYTSGCKTLGLQNRQVLAIKAEEEAAPEEPEETTEWSVDDPGPSSPLRAVREEWPAGA